MFFEQGINGIVGPNGAGKSNISDGIRWVMGETSAKAIRGDKKSKFIFSGSASRKASKEAVVELEFDNTKRILPSMDCDTVIITRKANLSGRSEYFINHKSCLLKEVQALFLDTGLGRDSYSMISQEQSKKLLSEKTEERRAIFEEAAGIVRMRSQKELSEKRLAEVNIDFTRLSDILKELEKQVKPLQKQSEKANTYLTLHNKLSDIEINYLAHRVQTLDSLIVSLEEQITLIREENAGDNETLSILEEEVSILKADIKALNDDIFLSQSSSNELSSKLENVRSDIKINNERITNSVNEIEEIEVELQDLKKQLSISAEDYSAKRERFYKNKDTLELLQAEKNSLSQSLFTLSEEASTQKLSSESLRETISKLYNELQECKIRFEQCHKDEERLKKEIDILNAQGDNSSNTNDLIENLNSSLSKLKIDLDIKCTSRSNFASQATALDNDISNLNDDLFRLNNQQARDSATLSSTESSFENFGGFYEGVKNVLKHKNELPGIVDAVSNLMTVKSEYTVAIDTLSSSFSQNVVANTVNDARNAVNYLKEKKLGRATFIPLNDLSPKSFNEQELNLIRNSEGICLATDLVDFKSEFTALFQHLIGRNLVSTNIDAATRFYEKSRIKTKIATLDGDIIQPGLISGGTQQSKKGLLSKKQELDSLKRTIAKNEQEIADLNVLLSKKSSSKKIILEQLNSLNAEINTIQLSISENEVKLNVLEQEAASKAAKSNDKLVATKELNYQLSESKKLSASLFKRIQELEVEYKEKSNLLSNTSSNVSDAEVSLSELKSKETTLLVEISQLEQENRSLADFIAGQELGKDTLASKLDALHNKKDFAVSRLDVANTSIDNLIVQEADLVKELDILNGQINRMINNKQSFESQLAEKEDALSNLRKQLKSSTEKLHSLDLELQNNSKSIESSISNAKDNYSLAKEDLLSLKVSPFNDKHTQQKIFDLKKDIKALGNVNIDSIKDFEELNARFSSEKEQLEDVRNAKKDLENLLSDISNVMANKFSTTFKSIAKHFEETFVELFGGGYAKLSLVEPKKPLDSQVEIIAQPPGKKPKSLELLSGGEKNLTVCALVFAILKAKPSPFVYLDEIDAPLDDANVARFAYYLQKIKGDTQFIVVTHRKGTMMASDRLFGVTQEIPGITTILPYQLVNDSFDFDIGVAANE